jgi:hypothetical protein
MGSRLVFTGDSAAANPRLWSGHPEAVQIVVRQSVEKIPEHSVTNRRVGPFHKHFRRKHWVFMRFVSVRLLRIPGRVLRFYYGRQRLKKSSR